MQPVQEGDFLSLSPLNVAKDEGCHHVRMSLFEEQ